MSNVKVVCSVATFDCKYTNLQGKGEQRKVNGLPILMKPDGGAEVVRKNTKGELLKYFNKDKDGKPIVSSGRGYCTYENVNGVDVPKDIVDKNDIVSYYQGEDKDKEGNPIITLIPCKKYTKTSVYEIKSFEPLNNYTDKYILDSQYGIAPYEGKSAKGETDHARQLRITANVRVNTAGMKKLYDYLLDNKVVGRAELNLTSGATLNTLAYIRPVPLDKQGNWVLEFGTFKQPKRFPWVGSAVIEETPIEQAEYEVAVEEI